jgi:hypothetical protein
MPETAAKTLPNYYEVLQVSPNADVEIIQAAHRRLVEKWHTERQPGDPTAFHRLALLDEAVTALSDPLRRKEYDLRQKQLTLVKQFDENGFYTTDHPIQERHEVLEKSASMATSNSSDQTLPLIHAENIKKNTNSTKRKEWYEPGWHWLVAIPLLMSFQMLREQDVFTELGPLLTVGAINVTLGVFVGLIHNIAKPYTRRWAIAVGTVISVGILIASMNWIEKRKTKTGFPKQGATETINGKEVWTEQDTREAKLFIEIATGKDIIAAVGNPPYGADGKTFTPTQWKSLLATYKQRQITSKSISHSVLLKIHPELPEQFARMLKCDEATVRMMETGIADTSVSASAKKWDEWYLAHYKEFRLH